MGPAPQTLDGWLAWLDDQVGAAADAIRAELGDATMCRIHKDGRVTGGLKYEEGRMAAFAEARRLGRTRANALDGELASFERRWLEELERRTSADQPSPPWVAYATGGAEAARSTLEVFARRDPTPPST